MDNGSVVEYRYTMFTDSELEFTSSDPIITVTNEGSLIIGDITENKTVVITAKDLNGEATASCTIHIDSTASQEYIGFAPTNDVNRIDLTASDSEGRPLFKRVDKLSGNQHVENYNTGYYLWIFSKTPIKDVQCKMFDVPMSDVVMDSEGHYCYYCLNPLIATDFDFTIER